MSREGSRSPRTDFPPRCRTDPGRSTGSPRQEYAGSPRQEHTASPRQGHPEAASAAPPSGRLRPLPPGPPRAVLGESHGRAREPWLQLLERGTGARWAGAPAPLAKAFMVPPQLHSPIQSRTPAPDQAPERAPLASPTDPWEALQAPPGGSTGLDWWARAALTSAAIVELLVPYLLEASRWNPGHLGMGWFQCMHDAGWRSTLALTVGFRALRGTS